LGEIESNVDDHVSLAADHLTARQFREDGTDVNLEASGRNFG
jgi:hypothetical protein